MTKAGLAVVEKGLVDMIGCWSHGGVSGTNEINEDPDLGNDLPVFAPTGS